ncbi:MAG: hypothetical protein ACK4F8_15055 [Aquabacterium sp.]
MLAVLAAIDMTKGATLVEIVSRTGLDKKTVTHMIEQAQRQAGVQVTKAVYTYRVEDWGPVIRRGGLRLVLTGELGDPVSEVDD